MGTVLHLLSRGGSCPPLGKGCGGSAGSPQRARPRSKGLPRVGGPQLSGGHFPVTGAQAAKSPQRGGRGPRRGASGPQR